MPATFFELKPHWDANALCASRPQLTWSNFTIIHVSILTFFACFAAFGLTAFVQSVLSLKTRINLMKFSHCLGGFLWMLALTVCSPWTFPFIVANTYLWGSEPYDNVFSRDMWRVALALGRKGKWVHVYWAVSSLVLHLWFVGGAAVITMGIERPDWIVLAILGFTSSHIARLFAYEFLDTPASILEVIGVLFLTSCLTFESLHWSNFRGIWLAVSVLERWTHIPSAVRRDAGWMRSYDLWLEAVREVPATSPEDGGELPKTDSNASLVANLCMNCRRSSFMLPGNSTTTPASVV